MYPFVAEIRVFFGNFAPTGWATCQGQLLPISQNTALFSLLGTCYGGDGRSTFALPDLSGRAPLHADSNYSNWGSQFQLGEQIRWEGLLKSDKYRPAEMPSVEPEIPQKKAKRKKAPKQSAPATGESLGRLELTERSLTPLQRLAENLGESQNQTAQLINSQAEIVNRILTAALQAREYQKKSIEGEYGDAGASLKGLVQTIEELNQDPNALPQLKKVVTLLRESHEQTRQMIEFQVEVAGALENAAARVGEYRAGLSRGDFENAGASLRTLIETVNSLTHMWDSDRGLPGVATMLTSEYPPSTDPGQSKARVRFLAVNFIIALQGVFPPRT
ncbi:MAG: hypothetical protein QOD75_3939 [Blastocatellia bacterium]|nr:hypothetical protein [Blastocatellia bacterium]